MAMETLICVLCDYEICCVRNNVDIVVLEAAEVKALGKLLQLPPFPFEGQVMRARFCYECKADIKEATLIYEKMAKHTSKLTTIREKLQNKLAKFSSNVPSATVNDVNKDSPLVTGSSVPLDIFRKQISQHLITISKPGLETTGTSSCQRIDTSTQSDLTPGLDDVKNEEVQPNIAKADKETQISECAHNGHCHSKMDVLSEDSTSTIVSADSSNPSTSIFSRNKSVLSCFHSPVSNRRILAVEFNSTETSEDSDQSVSTDECNENVAAAATKDYEKGVLDSSSVKPKCSFDVDATGPNTEFLSSQEHSSYFPIDGDNINISETVDVNTSVTPVMNTSGSSLQPEAESSYENSEDETDDQIGENKVTEHNLGSVSDIAVNCETQPMEVMNVTRPASIQVSPRVSSPKPRISMIPKLFSKQTPMLMLEKLPDGKMKPGQSSLVCQPDVGIIKAVMSRIHDHKYVTSAIVPTLSQGNFQGLEGTSIVQPRFNEDEVAIINEVSACDSAIQHQTLTKNQEQPKKNSSQSEMNGNLHPVAPAPANQNMGPALENENQPASGSESTMISQSEMNGNLHPVAPALAPANQSMGPALGNANQPASGSESQSTMISSQSEMNGNLHPVAPAPANQNMGSALENENQPASGSESTMISQSEMNGNLHPVAPALASANQSMGPALENANQPASGSESTRISLQSEMNEDQIPKRKRGRPKMINSAQSEMNQQQSPVRKRGRPKMINSSQSELTNNSTLVAPTPTNKSNSTPGTPTRPKKNNSTPAAPTPAKKTKSTPSTPTGPKKNNSTPAAPTPAKKTKSTPVESTPPKKANSTPVAPKSAKKNKSTPVSPVPAKKTKMSSTLETESRSLSGGKSATKTNGMSSYGRTLKTKETL